MFMSICQPAVHPIGPDVVAVPGAPSIAELSPRAMHAKLLQNAALRRLRGLERKQAHRNDDAGYWFSAAPLAVRKACELRREDKSFAALP